ncbi:MAG: methyltransferase domain-containing protein [Actinobacteria bacterium]|nr:MAG: methyltransferase domain-containing protein [Actinomycetota bacterium]
MEPRVRSGGRAPRRAASLGDFRNQHVLELGCGDGRLTLGIAAEAASVLAFDPDAEAIRVAVSRQPL